jgi:uncharacterized membrane protein
VRAHLDRLVAALGRPERAFVVVALAFGVPFLFLSPPFQAPDEASHFFRAFQVSEGHLAPLYKQGSPTVEIPASVSEFAAAFEYLHFRPEQKTSFAQVRAAGRRRLDARRRVDVGSSAEFYPPTAYAAQAVGIALGRLLRLRPLGLLYLARLAGLVTAVLVIAFALQLTGGLARSLMLVALLPMTLSQLASVTADAQLISCSFLLAALLLRLLFDRAAAVDGRTLALLAVIAALVTLTKPMYLALMLIFLAVPTEKTGGRARLVGAFAAVCAFAAGAMLAWHRLCAVRKGGSPYGGEAQDVHVIGRPLHFLAVMLEAANHKSWAWVESFIGKLGWLDVLLPEPLLLFCFGLLVVGTLTDSPPAPVRAWTRLCAAGAFLSATAGICFVLYRVWTPVAADTILGVQGRYFTPVAPAVALLLANRRVHIEAAPATVTRLFALLSAITLAITLACVRNRYYGA